jgi:hypothetical protein
VLAVALEGAEDLSAAVVIGDVIGHEVAIAHGYLVAKGGYSTISPVR